MPTGFFAAIAQWESNGQMTAGDPNLGEYGYFQIAANTASRFGLPPDLRKTPEGNIFLAGLEYQVEAAQLAKEYSAVEPGSVDQWMLARLVFAIGKGGTKKLLQLAAPLTPGHVYEDLVAYVNSHTPPTLGSQSPEKVKTRVNAVPIQWAVGQLARGGYANSPERIPAPAGLAYALPSGIQLRSPGGGALHLLALGIAATWALTS